MTRRRWATVAAFAFAYACLLVLGILAADTLRVVLPALGLDAGWVP